MTADSINELDVVGAVQQKNASPMVELGATGLKRSAGYLNEEFLPALKGRKAVQIYREMSDNDPIIGALLFAIDRLIRKVEWSVEPSSQDSEDKEIAEFVESCMNDMSSSWDDFISEVLTMLAYGWSYHEIVYKKRIGPWEKDGKNKSSYSDGRIGWRKMPIRSQETLQRWLFDESGGIKGMVQMSPPEYKMTYLPIERCLLFRTSTVKNSPEGKSVLRNAYRPWFYKKRLEEIEGIGVERDLAGLPVAKVPHDYLSAAQGTDKAKMVDAFKKMVRSVRRDEQEGVVIPTAYDQDTKQPLFDFSLLNSGGSRSFDTNAIIQRYEQRMLMSVLADFILVGHEGTGSYSMHLDKTGMFRAAVDSFVKAIENVLNMHALPRLLSVNGMKPKELPKFKAGDVDQPDLNQLATFMSAMASSGVQWFPDAEIEKFVRKIAGLPELDETKEQILEIEQRQSDVMRLAEQKMNMLGMEQQAEQGAMQAQQSQMQMEQQQQEFANQPDPREEQEFQRQMQMDQHEQQMHQKDEEHRFGLQQKTDEMQMTAAQRQQEMEMTAAQRSQEMAHQDKAKRQELTYAEKQKRQELSHSDRQKRQELTWAERQRRGDLQHGDKSKKQELKHKEDSHKFNLRAVSQTPKKNDKKDEKKKR